MIAAGFLFGMMGMLCMFAANDQAFFRAVGGVFLLLGFFLFKVGGLF